MGTSFSHLISLLLMLCYIAIAFMSMFCSSNNLACIQKERQSLIDFQNSITADPSNRLSSWVGPNCCEWFGIHCDNQTGHVIMLDLRNPYPLNYTRYNDNNRVSDPVYEKWRLVWGEVNHSLLDLNHLQHLDLSYNNFSGFPIPSFFGSFPKLRYLNLSSACFTGLVPHHLGNLSALHSFDISNNYDCGQMIVDDMRWVSKLSRLEYLFMSRVNLNQASNSIQALNWLHRLVELRLYECELVQTPLSVSFPNLTSLTLLDLSSNHFSGPLPTFLENMTSLETLVLFYNRFNGTIRVDLSQLCNLKVLDFSYNNLVGDTFQLFQNKSSLSFKTNKLETLYLSFNQLSGHLPNWLGQLKNLKYLDLSSNSFTGHIPSSLLGQLSSLSVLELSSNQLNGTIPDSFGQLSLLETLDLSYNQLSGCLPDSLGQLNLKWLSLSDNQLNGTIPDSFGQLSQLQSLYLSNNQLSSGYMPDWLTQLKNLKYLFLSGNSFIGHIPSSLLVQLSSLRELDLSHNQLNGTIPDSFGQFSQLETLDLSYNQLNGTIPDSFGHLSQLETLDLSSNQLSGHLPDCLVQLKKLEELHLSGNFLTGHIPSSLLVQLSSLRELDLSDNQLNGTIPDSFGQLSQLETLDLSSNSLEGILFNLHFSNMYNLKSLNLSYNPLTLKATPDWVPPFQLHEIDLNSCKLLRMPLWIQTQKELTSLNMRNASIKDSLPKWFFNFSSPLLSSSIYYDLSSNQIYGQLPNFLSPQLTSLILSNNSINGTIPYSLCKLKDLQILDLSMNNLTGLPKCLGDLQNLSILDLSSNKIFGNIPESIGNLVRVQWLHLNNNKLHGQIPKSLQNCTELILLDLGQNNLSGNISTWLGKKSPNLKFVALRSNKLNGTLSSQLCHLADLQALDLANNTISGTIPHCFGNFKRMKGSQTQNTEWYDSKGTTEKINVVIKGIKYEYTKTLPLLITLDLSSNNLVGSIPEELLSLDALLCMNLSNNQIRGMIPENIDHMQSLESLDLSKNHLSGSIPLSMSYLDYLGKLNLSWNNFSGKIPFEKHLQTLSDPSIYNNNPQLCGAPLNKKCSEDEVPTSPTKIHDMIKNEKQEFEKTWFYIGMASGHIVGFWGVCGALFFNKSWRIYFFEFLKNLNDRLFVIVAVNVSRLKRKAMKD